MNLQTEETLTRNPFSVVLATERVHHTDHAVVEATFCHLREGSRGMAHIAMLGLITRARERLHARTHHRR